MLSSALELHYDVDIYMCVCAPRFWCECYCHRGIHLRRLASFHTRVRGANAFRYLLFRGRLNTSCVLSRGVDAVKRHELTRKHITIIVHERSPYTYVCFCSYAYIYIYILRRITFLSRRITHSIDYRPVVYLFHLCVCMCVRLMLMMRSEAGA